MEGDPVDSWTTVDRKVSKRKPKVEASPEVDEGWSQVNKDRRRKDGPGARPGQDRGERRGDRRGDRGRPPTGGRGGSNQRNTLPRKYPPKESGGPGLGRSERNTPSPVPAKQGAVEKPTKKSNESEDAPRKSSWASLVNKPETNDATKAPPTSNLGLNANNEEPKEPKLVPQSDNVSTAVNANDSSGNENSLQLNEQPVHVAKDDSSSSRDVIDNAVENPSDKILPCTDSSDKTVSVVATQNENSSAIDATAETLDGLVLSVDNKMGNESPVINKHDDSDTNGNSLVLDTNKNTSAPEYGDQKEELGLTDGSETRHYDRDVLLQLQRHPLSLQKPDKLPELEIILSNPIRSSLSAPLLGELPSQYVHTFSRPPPAKRDSRRKESKKIISLSREPVKLHKAENAWQPSTKNQDDINAEEILSKEVRSILNKLTPQNFDKLVNKFKQLVIDTEKKLVDCMEIVFEKAVDEPAFSSAYASMCKELSRKVVKQENSDDPVNFIQILIRRCQKEFLADYISEEQRKKFNEDLASADTEELKKKIENEFQMLEQKMRRRSLGNIRFISELYNLSMLQGQIMFSIIGKLVKAVDEESLECLCRLLATSGARLEKEVSKTVNEAAFVGFFDAIESVIRERKTSSRVRFLLQDIVELRKNKWVGRRKEAGPKTIDEIHKEAQIEALRIQLADQRPEAPTARRSEERSRRKTEYRVKPISDGEWSNVPSKAAKISDVVDPERIKLIRKVDTDTIKLGPSGGRNSSWAIGSGTKTTETVTNKNRFQMLDDVEPAAVTPVYTGRASEPVRSSVDRSVSRGRPDATKTVSQNSSRDPSISMRSRPLLVGDPLIDGDKMRIKFRTLLDEYIINCDFEETFASICALVPHKLADAIVEETFNHGMEKKEKEQRSLCGNLLSNLLNKDCLTVEHVVAGLGGLLEFASDIIIDIPKFWDYTADILCRILLQADSGDLILEKCCSYLEKEMQDTFVKSTLNAAKSVSETKLGNLLNQRRTVFEKLIHQDFDEFIAENNLQASGEPEPIPEHLTNGNRHENLYRKLTQILDKKNPGNEEMSQIDTIMCDITLVNETVRTLITAVIESVVDGIGGPSVSCTLNKDVFLARVPLLKKYLDANKDLEMSALFAIQNLVHKLEHPNKLLHNILEVLYDKDCVSEDALLEWEKNEDPEEQEGKGVALKSCTQFFEWLKTAEEEEEGQVV